MFWRVLMICLVLPLASFAQELPTPLSDTISDFADLLPPKDEARLTEKLQAIRAETGVQMVVATMDRIPEGGGAGNGIEAYAKALFNAWGIGDKTRNDGILILVARDDRAARIALGAGYDAVYDGRASRVLDTAMLPEFREGRYMQGIEAGITSAKDRLITPFLAKMPVTETSGFENPRSYGFLIPVGMVAAFFAFVFRRRIGDQAARLKRCENCNHRGLERSRDITVAASAYNAGSGILHDHCNACGHDRQVPYTIAPTRSNKSGGSGGSSGFGGGKSSGGGATGRW